MGLQLYRNEIRRVFGGWNYTPSPCGYSPLAGGELMLFVTCRGPKSSLEKSRRLNLRTGRSSRWAVFRIRRRSAIWVSTGVFIRYLPHRRSKRVSWTLWTSGIPFRSSRKTRSAGRTSIPLRR